MQSLNRHSLWDLTARASVSPLRFVSDAVSRVTLSDLAQGSSLGAAREGFLDRSVMILCAQQLPAVLALLQLDGLARRMLLCPPDLAGAHLPAVIAEAEVDVILSDGAGPVPQELAGVPVIACPDALVPAASTHDRSRATEWLLFTSGTTGRPKMVVHTLQSLTSPLDDGLGVASDAIWSTFYDIRRYGGLQILLRCLLGGGSLGPVTCRRGSRGFSSSRWAIRCNAHVGHAVALAPGIDERGGGPNVPALHSSFRRSGRPVDPQQTCPLLFRIRCGPCLCLDRGWSCFRRT